MPQTLALPAPISGELNDKDLKRLVQEMRASTVGPTTTYYAGVTAPIIGGSMAFVSAMSFKASGMPPQWASFLAALFAAIAGIVWYLIFMRWSYRARSGRQTESAAPTTVRLEQDAIIISRGPVTQQIAWSALKEVRDRRRYTLLCFDGADPLIVPNAWFGKDESAKEGFQMFLRNRAS
ncbi:MAG: YcxB family protein [Pseudomonadota bacterium]